MRPRVSWIAGLLVALSFVAACATSDGAPWSGGPVNLVEYDIRPGGWVWTDGEVALDVRNGGEFSHTLVVSKDDGTVVVASDVLGPGDAAELVVDLEPGEYQLTCRIVVEASDGQVVDHYERGMHTEIVVQG